MDTLFHLYKGRVPHECDLVCYWFEKARAMIAQEQTKRAGLLATQGIRGGANLKVLQRIKESGSIFWAQSDRNWVLDGATVHVSMIGFDDGSELDRFLNGVPKDEINADLTSSIDLSKAKKLDENKDLSFMGVTPAGSFDISGDLARKWLRDPLNPNGRPNSDVLRPYYNGIDLARRSRDVWIVDFGVDMPLEEAALYEKPFEHIQEIVKPQREKSRVPSHQPWWLFTRSRPTMREALFNLGGVKK